MSSHHVSPVQLVVGNRRSKEVFSIFPLAESIYRKNFHAFWSGKNGMIVKVKLHIWRKSEKIFCLTGTEYL